LATELFVNGTLMRGLRLHPNLGPSQFLGERRTAACYRLYSIDDIHPGMFRLEPGEEGGVSIAGELYLIEDRQLQVLQAREPSNLYRGYVLLDDGRETFGILYPRFLAEGWQRDITAFGSWRAYLASRK
jgi:gamma-glutamylcyclotransferase (GGCT)/AIG2-like uncharacterized protein YtfP